MRRIRVGEPAADAEALIRQMVGKLQNQGSAESERVREGIQRAIAILQGLVA